MSGSGGAPGSGGSASGSGGSGTGGGDGDGVGGGGAGGGGAGGGGTGGGGTGGGSGGAATGGVGPSIISVDFVGGRTTTSGIAMAATETAGAKPAAHWNSAAGVMGTLSALVLSNGSTSSASVSWNAPTSSPNPGTWSVNYTDAPGDVRMMNGYLDPAWTTAPATAASLVTVSGLPAAIAADSYDVYVYVLGSADMDMRTYQYAIGARTFTVVQNTPPAIPPASPYPYAVAADMGSGTHVIFPGVTGASFTLLAKGISGTNSRFRAPVNGIQIVFPSGS